jgi:hypothetical protein
MVWKIYAAFGLNCHPSLKSVTFGIHYTPGVLILDHGRCGSSDFQDTGWPNSESCTTVAWNTAQASLMTEVYWFGGYGDGYAQTF